MLVLISHQWTIHLRCLWTWMQLVVDFLEFSTDKCGMFAKHVLKVLEMIGGIFRGISACRCMPQLLSEKSLELLQLQQVCECLWYSGYAGHRRMVCTRLYERGNRGSAKPEFCGSVFPWNSVSSCLDYFFICFDSKCVAAAEVKDENFNGDY